jgi:uncharacterized GH25 family protein
MKKQLILLVVISLFHWLAMRPAMAGAMNMGHGDMQETGKAADMKSMADMKTAGTFSHAEVSDGVRAEFQVMSLASMNMKDPDGKTHHIMVTFFNDATNEQIPGPTIGKIKLIEPSGAEQLQGLTNYNGIYAANFTIDQPGKYGVICMFKTEGKKRLVKFWYPNE